MYLFVWNLKLCVLFIIGESENYFMVDSMSLGVVKLSRSNSSKICKKEFYSSPNRGFCASQNMNYYGYKYVVCSIEVVFKSFDTSKDSVCDIRLFKCTTGVILEFIEE